MRRTVPPEWLAVMEPKGITSGRQLALTAGVSPETIWRMLRREGDTSPETVAAVAEALFDGDRNRVYELTGSDKRDHDDFELPAEASRLTPRQRHAVLMVVRSMLEPDERGGMQRAAVEGTTMGKMAENGELARVRFELRHAREDVGRWEDEISDSPGSRVELARLRGVVRDLELQEDALSERLNASGNETSL